MGDGGQRKNKIEGWTATAAGASSPELSARMLYHHHDDEAVINRIMLRFRPIAPKPATDGSVSDPSKMDADTAYQLAKQKPMRRYVRINNYSISSRRRCKSTAKEVEKRGEISFEDDVVQHTGEIGSATAKTTSLGLGLGLGLSVGSDRSVVESWVVVTGVTETTTMLGGGGGMLGSTDREKMRNLERDTCPGMISDGEHRVQWVNKAYRRMVMEPGVVGERERRAGEEEEVEVRVWLELKEEIPEGWAVFACRVRVAYRWGKEKYTKQCRVMCGRWRSWVVEMHGGWIQRLLFAWDVDEQQWR